MKKVDLITTSAMTASDGSVVASGATLKFDSEFMSTTTMIRVQPRLYRNRELFEMGYSEIKMPEETIPDSIIINIADEVFYELTPLMLYEEVANSLNNIMGNNMFQLNIIEE